jgi:hypothetical protein
MKYLIYCILRTGEIRQPACPQGVEGQPVCMVEAGGLSAVTSRLGDEHLTPDLPRILAYQKVVAAFHDAQTVIPMRYGCVVEEQSAIARLLEERRPLYERLLKELDGCEEMGIRIIPTGTEAGATPSVHSAFFRNDAVDGILWSGDSPRDPHGGQAYLAAQKLLYAARDRLTQEEEKVAGRVCAHLDGLFIRRKIETAALDGHRLISLYLLAPRGSVPAFRMAFQQLCAFEKAKLLLSGPWPPYNFAQADRAKL